tara:strand:- start:1578 stop:1895 length:318 start_codon:yes stop_codon:yes gene_type:complete
MKNTILKLPENTKGSFSEPKIMGSLNAIGYRLTPVQGSYNKFWFVRKVEEDGQSYDFINGPKYYKLVVDSREISVECGGDYNGWSFANELRLELNEYAKSNKEAA